MRIPEVVSNPDRIESGGETKLGRETIRYEKRINGHIIYVEEVRTKRNNLAPLTMYKRKVGPGEGGPDGGPGAPGATEPQNTVPATALAREVGTVPGNSSVPTPRTTSSSGIDAEGVAHTSDNVSGSPVGSNISPDASDVNPAPVTAAEAKLAGKDASGTRRAIDPATIPVETRPALSKCFLT